MDEKMLNRMLARGVAESMLRAGGKLPVRRVSYLSVAGTVAYVAAVAIVVGVTVVSLGVN